MSHEVQQFETQVIQRSKQVPVLVDFWAPWCGPCRTLGPVLERMAAQAGGRWEFVKVNTEEHQELAAALNIASIPAVKLFVNGAKVRDRYLAGATAVRAGDFAAALPTFIEVLERDKGYDNAGAKEACSNRRASPGDRACGSGFPDLGLAVS